MPDYEVYYFYKKGIDEWFDYHIMFDIPNLEEAKRIAESKVGQPVATLIDNRLSRLLTFGFGGRETITRYEGLREWIPGRG